MRHTLKYGVRDNLLMCTPSKSVRNAAREKIHRIAREKKIRVRSECISPTRIRVFAESGILHVIPRWVMSS